MSNNTEFKWTDELITEFFTKWITDDLRLPEQMQKFKESKQPKPEWEIIEYCHKPTNAIVTRVSKYWEAAVSGEDEDYEIHSVKRSSDNEVFSIGDEVVYGKGMSSDIIEKIKLKDNRFGPDSPSTPFFFTENSFFGYYIDEINHYKEPVFTTEDGIVIYKDYSGKISAVYEDFSFNYDCQMHQILHELDGSYPFTIKYFSTKEAAREFILNNKPVFSLKEITTVGNVEDHNPYYKKLVALAESKLK